MKYLRFAATLACFASASLFAQNAEFKASTTTLAATGGSIVLTASVNYAGQPGAVGWSIVLPANWTLESVTGPNVPAIAPEVGTTGTLEFAYAEVPAHRAEFSVIVRYPAGAAAATATPTVHVRADGNLTTLKPAAIELSAR